MKYCKYIVLTALSLFCFAACYEDLSTEATKEIPDIIFGDGQESITVLFGDELVFDPQVTREDGSTDGFEFLWEVDLNPKSSTDRIELGDEPILEYKVGNKPSELPYTLSLQVVDTKSGLFAIKGWKLFVDNSLGEGYIVAHTKDGGKTSDIDFVASPAITYGYLGTDPRYVRELYSFANGEPCPGRINLLMPYCGSVSHANDKVETLVATDSEFFALDQYGFTRTRANSELFYSFSDPECIVTDMFNFAKYASALIVNGKFYGMACNGGDNYSQITFLQKPDNVFSREATAYDKVSTGALATFSKAHGDFFWLLGWNIMMTSFTAMKASCSFPLTEADAIGSGAMKKDNLGFLLRTGAGDYKLCVLDMSGESPKLTEYDVNGENMDGIVSTAYCDNADLFYYATERNIYANVVSGGKVTTRKLSWAPESEDEKITMLQHYKQAWYGAKSLYPSDYEYKISTHQLQMLIVTYNEKTGEGKIYLRPFNVSTGLFTYKDNGTFGGFNEITAISPTLK